MPDTLLAGCYPKRAALTTEGNAAIRLPLLHGLRRPAALRLHRCRRDGGPGRADGQLVQALSPVGERDQSD